MLRGTSTTGPAGKEAGIWFPILSTQPFSLNWMLCHVFQPVLTRPLITTVRTHSQGLSLHCVGPTPHIPSTASRLAHHTAKTMDKKKYMVPRWVCNTPEKCKWLFHFKERNKKAREKHHYSVEEMGRGLKLNDRNA